MENYSKNNSDNMRKIKYYNNKIEVEFEVYLKKNKKKNKRI